MQWIYGIILNQTQKLNKFIAYTKMETKVEGRKTACDYYKSAPYSLSWYQHNDRSKHMSAYQNTYKCILLHMYSRYAACLKFKKKKKNKASNYDHKLLKFKKSIIYFN